MKGNWGKKWEFSGGKVASGMTISHEAQRAAWTQTKHGNEAFGMLMPPKTQGATPWKQSCVKGLSSTAPFSILFPPEKSKR